MCLAQGPQRSDASEAQTRGPLVSSQALYHCAPIRVDGVPLHLNYLFDKEESIGEDGKLSHGPNAGIAMIHDGEDS